MTMIKDTPDYKGPGGSIWRIDLAAAMFAAGRTIPDGLFCRQYLLHSPMAHPLWSHYVLSVVSLNEVEGLPPPVKEWGNATHELSVLAIHPDHEPSSLLDLFIFLNPPNVVVQMSCTDPEADAALRSAAIDCAAGRLSPDSDFRRFWKARFPYPQATISHKAPALEQ